MLRNRQARVGVVGAGFASAALVALCAPPASATSYYTPNSGTYSDRITWAESVDPRTSPEQTVYGAAANNMNWSHNNLAVYQCSNTSGSSCTIVAQVATTITMGTTTYHDYAPGTLPTGHYYATCDSDNPDGYGKDQIANINTGNFCVKVGVPIGG